MNEATTTAPGNRLSAEKAGLDDLTGVWNRAGFIAAATPMFMLCQRRGAPVTLGYFDIRSARETRSASGDTMLNGVVRAVANQMGETFRDCDIVGRIAPARLAVLFAECTDDALVAIEGVRAVADESTPANANILTVAIVESAAGATFADLMLQADLRTNELRLRDAGVMRPAEPVWTMLPPVPAKPEKRRARSRR